MRTRSEKIIYLLIVLCVAVAIYLGWVIRGGYEYALATKAKMVQLTEENRKMKGELEAYAAKEKRGKK